MANELRTRCESSSESSAEHAVLLNSCRPTRREHLKACCKPTYNIRRLKNKSAIIVLIINYLTMSLFYYIIRYGIDVYIDWKCFITWGLTVLLVGWLADVILGRYRTIYWSILIMWTGTVLSTVSSVVAYFATTYKSIDKYMSLVLFIIATIGLASYQANVIQFGLDQLQDASTDEITSYLSWFSWTVINGGIFVALVNKCINDNNQILIRLLVCFCLSIALIMSILSKNMFNKEPVTQNPFKLVYKVIKYAIKNKQPRCRSAFTYCEDDLPSRIDFGKSKYGGPFTTEQVEDVKTFFRVLTFICLGCTIPGIITTVNLLTDQLSHLTHDSKIANTITVSCHFNKFYEQVISSTLIALLIPLYEFAIYPVLRRHFSWVKSHSKILVGVLLLIAEEVALMVFVLKVRHTHLEESGYNATLQCIFHEERGASNFDSRWILLPSVLEFLSIVIMVIGYGEFICAQTPYSMRGLMFGAVYCTLAVSSLIGYSITQLFTSEIIMWGEGIISCEFWYLLLNILFLGFTGFAVAIFGRWYKKRKREDVLPNEQIFAEEYYTK